ncbi:MAG TPA: hypothetical protein VFP43_19925, partial [Mesorhizobium sp.]|nr:hypothetical protein [Mesorhizobium sp.]
RPNVLEGGKLPLVFDQFDAGRQGPWYVAFVGCFGDGASPTILGGRELPANRPMAGVSDIASRSPLQPARHWR